jgi:dipeptidyl aminopeptidase/acylaminoacyl peptidase
METGPMHDDQIRGLLRSLEDDREPDPTFADALFDQLTLAAGGQSRRRTPMLLLAAALLVALAASIAVGSGLVRLPFVVDVDASPEPTSSGVAVASPTPSASAPASPQPSTVPSVAPDPASLAGRTLFASADGLRLRSEASAGADVVATLRSGQLMSATGNQLSAEGMEWYEVRIGPGDTHGWVASGPDGSWLRLVEDGQVAFACEGCGGAPAVVSVTPYTDQEMTTIGEQFADYQWSPDGSRIAMTISDQSGTSVAVADADGSNRRILAVGAYAPSWSPDGTRLAWATGSAIVVTDAELTPGEVDLGSIRSPGTPLWSPDGTRLAFTAIDCPECPPDEPIFGDPPTAIFTVGVDGNGLVQLVGGAYWGVVAWAPDGRSLAGMRFDLSGEFPTRAFIIDVEGGEPEYLLGGAGVSGPPTWSPDGTSVAVPTTDGLIVLDGQGDNPRTVATDGETGIWTVRWAPSGRTLVYGTGGSSAATGLDLWVVPADGSDTAQRFSAESASAQNPQWQPILVELP